MAMGAVQFSFDLVSLVIGVAVGVLAAFAAWKLRFSTDREQTRDLKTRLTSQSHQLDRARKELADTKAVVARMLAEGYENLTDDVHGADEGPDSTDSDPLRLTMVAGIGPKLAITLASYGVTDLVRLASLSEQQMTVIESSAPSLADRMTREGWKQQAIRLLELPPVESLPDGNETASIESFDWISVRERSHPPANGSSGLRH
jgi:predicted flap endonuclease-1-like 5' DNA nuclease